jgi:lipopolysaccharide biosynthesis glycosyltransferase
MENFAAMGVADAASPFVSSPWGVPYWARYGRRADEMNFNSGVLLMNVAAWREENLAEAAFAYLTDGRHQFMVDQEAINAVLPGRIGEIDPRWNQQSEHFVPRFEATLPYSEDTVRQLLKDPWIVHFTTNMKAWTYGCTHEFRQEWFESLDQTPFRGWRPARPSQVRKRLSGVKRRITRGGTS